MDYAKNSITNLAMVSVLFAGVLVLCVWTPAISLSFSPLRDFECSSSSNMNTMAMATPKDELEVALEGASMGNKTVPKDELEVALEGDSLMGNKTEPKDELEVALEEASMGNKTVAIAIVNKAYVEGENPATMAMLDIFLESFWLGEDTQSLLDHLLIVAVDQIAFDRCKFRGLHCYRLVTDGVDFGGEKLYMSDDFVKMMWSRTLFLADVLKRGFSFIFTDTDVMWLRNPFLKLSQGDEGEDLQISCDNFKGNPWSETNAINTGFYFVRSNNKTISLFNKWYAMKDKSKGKKEQDVLQNMMRKGVFRVLGLKVRFLDTLYFSGFCQNSRDFRAVTTVHANCCRSINAKVTDLLAVLGDWKRFKGLTNETMIARWSKHNACISSWKQVNGVKN